MLIKLNRPSPGLWFTSLLTALIVGYTFYELSPLFNQWANHFAELYYYEGYLVYSALVPMGL